ncbi:MAG: Fic family protein [Pseudomonadota bacterium]
MADHGKTRNATTLDNALLLYAELSSAQIRAVQRRLKAGELQLISKGIATDRAPSDWPALIARDRIRVLAALVPGTVLGYRSAFHGGQPVDGVVYLIGTYPRTLKLPGLTVAVFKGAGPQTGDMPMQGKDLYFPSEARQLMENLATGRGAAKKAAGKEAVEERLLNICNSRGEEALSRLRDLARGLAPVLDLEKEFTLFDGLVGSILRTRPSVLTTRTAKALTAVTPYDPERMALFEKLAVELRRNEFRQPVSVVRSEEARLNFSFLESYFSNFIEGTEFDVQEARGFVLDGKPIESRPKDSHDILGVFRQAIHPAWANQTMAIGESVIGQIRARHADQMAERPEVGPGQFKVHANRAGNTEFVAPALVRGTLIEATKILPTVPAGTARALMAMFLVSEIHPFMDGNGRLARLVMNSELSVVGACRIIVPTLFRDEYLDCLRVLTREGQPAPFIAAMQRVQDWTVAFDYSNIDLVINQMSACNAFERSRVQFQLLTPGAP